MPNLQIICYHKYICIEKAVYLVFSTVVRHLLGGLAPSVGDCSELKWQYKFSILLLRDFQDSQAAPRGEQGDGKSLQQTDADRNTGAFKMNPKVRRAPGPEPIPSPAPNPVLQPPCAILWQNMGGYFFSPDLTGSLRPAFPTVSHSLQASPLASLLLSWLFLALFTPKMLGVCQGLLPVPCPSHTSLLGCARSCPGSLMSSPPVLLNPVSNTLVTNILCHHPVTLKGNDIHMHIIPKRKPSQCSN